jgi:hypothetical protein
MVDTRDNVALGSKCGAQPSQLQRGAARPMREQQTGEVRWRTDQCCVACCLPGGIEGLARRTNANVTFNSRVLCRVPDFCEEGARSYARPIGAMRVSPRACALSYLGHLWHLPWEVFSSNAPRSAAGGETTTQPRVYQQRRHRHCPARRCSVWLACSSRALSRLIRAGNNPSSSVQTWPRPPIRQCGVKPALLTESPHRPGTGGSGGWSGRGPGPS